MLNQFKYFEQKNQKIFIQKCFNTLSPKYVPGGKIFQYHQVVYYFPVISKRLTYIPSL